MTAAEPAPPVTGRRAGAIAGALVPGAAVAAAAALLLPWARVTGSSIPDTADPAQEQVARAGAPQEFTARGASGTVGALLLVVCCALVAVALWRLSPSYRPYAAGYLVIIGAALGGAAALWFLLDEQRREELFGSSVLLQADTMAVTVWPWVTLVCFAVAGAAGVLLVPGRGETVRTAGTA